jgi:hypothetical protein
MRANKHWKPGCTLSDIIPAMIAEREQALADVGLREPGVRIPTSPPKDFANA